MTTKLTSNKFSIFLAFLFAFIGLAFFASYKIPFLSQYFSLDANKNLVLLSLSVIATLLYFIFTISKKEIFLPENKIVRFLFILFPVFVILSSLFSGNWSNSFFGKYIYLQSGVTYLSIFFLTYIIASYFRIAKRFSWLLFVFANLFVTIPVILGVILSKFGAANFANKLVYFVDSWDIVAAICGVVIIFSLVYYETIASTKTQKWLSGILITIHLLLLSLVIIPDIWYSLLFSSLLIFFISRRKNTNSVLEEMETKSQKSTFYKKYSFYVFIISLIFSFIFLFSSSFTGKISNALANFSNKYSGINYNFIKPKLNISLGLAGSQITKGHLFGSGPSEFYKVWQAEKPQSVINSAYWGTEFSSSYSTFTTLFTTLGILGIVLILVYLAMILWGIYKKFTLHTEESKYTSLDEENKFYFLGGSALFIYFTFLFLFFANILLTLVLLAISIAFVLPYIMKWKEIKSSKMLMVLAFLMLVATMAGATVAFNRARAAYISNKSISTYQKDGNINNLEVSLVKAARISNDDSAYRVLTQFYIFKTRQIISQAATNTESLQKDVLTAVNNSIVSANTAISLDPKDFNNYMSLGSAYTFLMSFDQQNRDADYAKAKKSYEKALSLNPKNPSIYLSLAELEYAYSQSADNTISTINKSLQLKPNYSSAFYLLSQLAVQNNNRDSALQYAAQAIESDPQNVDAYMQYGILTLNKKELTQQELNEAYTAFVSALQLNPNNLTAAYYLTVTYILAKEWERAKALIAELKKVLPDDQRIVDLEQFLISSGGGNAQPVSTSTATSTAR